MHGTYIMYLKMYIKINMRHYLEIYVFLPANGSLLKKYAASLRKVFLNGVTAESQNSCCAERLEEQPIETEVPPRAPFKVLPNSPWCLIDLEEDQSQLRQPKPANSQLICDQSLFSGYRFPWLENGFRARNKLPLANNSGLKQNIYMDKKAIKCM